MSFIKSLVAAASVAYLTIGVDAFSTECGVGSYKSYLLGFALGFQTDPTDIETDCYASTAAWTVKLNTLDTAVRSFSTSEYLEPVYIM